jgi:hypothetical protein
VLPIREQRPHHVGWARHRVGDLDDDGTPASLG